MLGPAIMLAFLLFNPFVVGLAAYRTRKLWPAGICLGLLLTYTVLAVPLVLNAAPPEYCHGQTLDCPDPDTRGFTFVLGFALLIANCIAATIGGIFGDDSAPTADDPPARLFIGRAVALFPPAAEPSS